MRQPHLKSVSPILCFHLGHRDVLQSQLLLPKCCFKYVGWICFKLCTYRHLPSTKRCHYVCEYGNFKLTE